ncbi:MAG: MarC family protein [Gemmatimonadetes bacterium]|nr:MarC family protein [Gemmatimonadota bacterium]NNF13540.1 MarC family protein [Gemmatimonadota bacterium]
MSILSATILLFLVIDPVGNVPFFLTALKDVDPSRHMRVVARELLVALAVLVAFLFAGPVTLRAIHISQPSLTVAGGIILFLIALRMVFPSPKTPTETMEGEPFIVPLAIPLVAGPSAMAALIMISSQEPERRLEWLTALVLAWLLSSAIILGASRLKDVLGQRGIIAVERLMGMVLVAVAVQMLMSGVAQFVDTL